MEPRRRGRHAAWVPGFRAGRPRVRLRDMCTPLSCVLRRRASSPEQGLKARGGLLRPHILPFACLASVVPSPLGVSAWQTVSGRC